MTHPTYVSYYTPRYEDHAKRLIRSLDAYDLPHCVTKLSFEFRSWVAACAFKPTFLRGMMEMLETDICWLDADAEVMAPPVLFESIRRDIAIVHRLNQDEKMSWMTGTILLRFNHDTHDLLKEWQRQQFAAPHDWDQATFDRAFRKVEPTVFELPRVYCCKFDQAEKADAIILQHQASRQFSKD